jgi:hypothetical protein
MRSGRIFPLDDSHGGLRRTNTRSYLVSVHDSITGIDEFPIQKCAILRKFKDIKELRGGVLVYTAQVIPPRPVTSLA